jgi:nucleoside-diphosphate-sugar epimerase
VIALTGGSGLVGRRLAQALTADDTLVRVLSRHPARVALPAAVQWSSADLTEPSTLGPALQSIDTVIHLAAALPGPGVPATALDRVNVAGTAALASAARVGGIRRFIHLSSAGVYGDGSAEEPHEEGGPVAPMTPYERSKLGGERALEAALEGSATAWTILRPTGLYAAERPATADFFAQVARRALWLHGPARVITHPMHVLDLVGAILATLRRDVLHGEVINLGGARPIEYRELIALVGERVGHTPWQVSAPRWSGRAAAGLGRAWRVLGDPPERLRRLAQGRVNRSVSLAKARRLLGYEPMPLERGLDETAAALRRAGRLSSGRRS